MDPMNRSDQSHLGAWNNVPGTANAGSGAGVGMDMDASSPLEAALDPDLERLDENDPNVARDPVCGKLVDKRTCQNTLAPPVNTQLETLYFSSPECKAIFEEDPHRFGYNF